MKKSTLQLVQQEVGASKHIPYTHLNSETVFELKNGQVGCVIHMKGVPFDTAIIEELNEYKRIRHHALCAIGEEFSIYEYTIRKKQNIDLCGEFGDSFSRSLNERYHQQFQNKSLYRNEFYTVLLYKGQDSGKMAGLKGFFDSMSRNAIKTARDSYRQSSIDLLMKASQQFIATMSRFQPRLLGEHDEHLGYSELMEFLGGIVNGLDAIPHRYRGYAAPMLKTMDPKENVLSKYPHGNLAYYLPSKRLFFGDFIEFSGAADQSRFGAMLSIKSYGTETASIMLNKLLFLDCEFVITNSFSIEPNEIAQARILKQLIRMENANDPAASQIEELARCRDDLASERLRVGYHHNTVMLLSDDIEHLKSLVLQAIKVYSDIGFVALQESLGMEPAFWAQLPGNQQYVVRSSLITSLNFVDFCPLHNYRTGYCNQNHLGSAVTLIETPSRTPLFFNYHSRGSGDINDLTPGHTTIIGGNGSGKTVFMGFMDAQMGRYGGRSFFFDRDRGMEIYVRACGGVYITISPDSNQGSTFNPFWLDDSPSNRLFLKSWMGQLVTQEHEEELPASIEFAISHCIDYGYDSLSKEHRSLSSVAKLLPIDFPRWDRLQKWLRGDGVRKDGDYAYLFDNAADDLDVSLAKTGFDFTEVLNQPTTVLTATCMYLVHRIKESLNGQRVSIYFDEGWQILDNSYWKKQLKKDLPTLRKMNAHIILATQSPDSVVNSSLSAQFLDNCATNIFFSNPTANFEKHYQHFDVSPSEFDFIKNTPREYRLFLYKQAMESAICRLNLAGMEDILAVLSGNKRTVMLLDKIRGEVGDNPEHWLPLFHQRRQEVLEHEAINHAM